MRSFPKIFVIILNYNGKDFIKKCLASVFKNEYPNFEVVVVDNDSKDGSLEEAKSNFSKAHFIKNETNLGFSAGNNIGIKFALERAADYVFLLNYDTEAEKDCLVKLVEVGEKEEQAGILSPIIFNGKNKQVWFSGGKISWLTMKTRHLRSIKTIDYYETGFISGCAMLIKKKVFREVGLLDENFFLYWEDADFSWRAKRASFKNLVVTGSWVYHFEESEGKKENKTYWLVVSGLMFFKKNTPLILKPWIKVYVFLRKIKNKIDVLRKKNELAKIVARAYKDYKINDR